ncbi:zinc finger protein 2 homolog isoform X1 [Alosa sapidissima]|uniref:zinc finger protein 2 homolog isoform X1 n=1 Tax=Alosa sapidissima TaxID=34773 RepID=UPI001C09DB68|nr:zinc finger protein 2 homolog isoform X1 [Alosa sapidissima]
MAQQWCCVPLCANNKQTQPYLSFYTFPRDVELRRKWMQATKIFEGPLSKISDDTVVCSLHFRSSDLLKTTGGFKRLKKDAVPCMFRSESTETRVLACGHEDVGFAVAASVALDHTYDIRPSPGSGKRVPGIFGSSSGTMGKMEERPLSSGCNETETHQVDLRLIVNEEHIKEEEYGHMISCQVKDEEEKPFAEPHCKIETDDTDNTESRDETLQTPAEIEVKIEEDEQDDNQLESVSEHPHLRQQKIHGQNDELNLQLQGRLHHCTVCRRSFSAFTELQKHQQIHTSVAQKQNTNKNCDLYGKSFPLISNGDKLHQCAHCGKVYATDESLKHHIMLAHTTKKRHKCAHCGKVYATDGTLKHHITLTHTTKKRHKCVLCGKRFKLISTLNIHMNVYCKKKVRKCLECGKVFSKNMQLKSHMRTHTGEKPHKCVQCGKAFATSQSLKSHMFTHTGEKPHKCVHCEKAFKTSQGLKRHMLTHTKEELHECSQCGKAFRKSQDLKRHMLTHTKEELRECSQCGKAFGTSQDLKRHMLTHTKEELCECSQCGKAFGTSQDLKRHMLTHTGEILHICVQCAKAFRTYQDMKCHMLTHIGGKPHKCV